MPPFTRPSCHPRPASRPHAWLVVIVLLVAAGAWPRETAAAPPDLGALVLQLHQRVLAVGQSLLAAEDALIFRLEHQRPVDIPRETGRIISARRQIVLLRRLALQLEPRLPPGDPRFPEILAAKGRFPQMIQSLRERWPRLQALAGPEIRQAAQEIIAESGPLVPLDVEDFLPLAGISDGLR